MGANLVASGQTHYDCLMKEELLTERVREMYGNGLSRPEIVRRLQAEGLDIDYGRVYHLTFDMAGIKVDITQVKAWIGDRPRSEVIMELYDQGTKPVEICRQLSLDHKMVLDTIYRVRQKRAVEEAKKRFNRLPESPLLKKSEY
jgi:hypothetical protein